MPSSTGTLVFNDQKIQAPDIYATESLGVGVSDPTSNLQVVGNAYVSSNLEVGTANLFVDTTTGNVGVGTGSPLEKLDVNGIGRISSDYPRLDLFATTSRSTNDWGNSTGAAGDYRIYSNGDASDGTKRSLNFDYGQNSVHTTRMCINALGNVGIGTVNPYSNFHVYTAGGGPSSTDCLVLGDPSGSAAVNLRLGAETNYSWIQSHEGSDLRLNPSGNTIKYGSGGTTLSDDRIKDNEEYIRDATQTLLKLKPQIYDKHLIWDLSSEDASNVNTVMESGLITQDVWYDTPELRHLVHLGREAHPSEIKPYTDDDPQNDPDYSTWGNEPSSLNYTGLIPYLIKSNQELHTELQDTKAQLTSVLGRLDALENP